MEDFVDQVLAPLHLGLVEMEDLLPALADDDRVCEEYRFALACRLDFVMYDFLEVWKTGLLEGPDEDEE